MSILDEIDGISPDTENYSVDDILSEFTDEDLLVQYSADDLESIMSPDFSGTVPEFDASAVEPDHYAAANESAASAQVSPEEPESFDDSDYKSPFSVEDILSSAPSGMSSVKRPTEYELSSFIESFRSGAYLEELENEELPAEEPPAEVPPEDAPIADEAEDEPAGDDFRSYDETDYEDDETVPDSIDEFDEDRKAGLLSGLKNSKLFSAVARRNKPKDDFVLNENERPKPLLHEDYDDEDIEYVNDTAEFAAGDQFASLSFKDYLSSIMMTVLYKLRGAASVVLTMEDKSEELGDEVPPRKAFKYYGNNIRPMKLRLMVCGILLIFMAWISLGLPVTGMLKTAKTASAVVMGFQLTIMLLSLDVVTNALMNAARGRLGLDSIAVIACIATTLDALMVSTSGFVSPHIALCFISSLSLAGVLYSDMLTCCGMRKSIRVPAIGRKITVMHAEYDEHDKLTHLVRSEGSAAGFVRRSEETPPDENMFTKLSLVLFAASFILAVICAIATKDLKDIMYFISLFLCISAPVCGLMCFSLPFLFGANKIFSSGAAICGWSGVSDIGHSDKLIITDADLFPAGHIKLGSYRIYRSSDERKIIAYAASILAEAGTSLAYPFVEKADSQGSKLIPVMNFEVMAGGGFKAIIDSRVILCGSSDFMHLMNVPILANHITDTSVLLAVNNELSGIFNMEYSNSPEIKRALTKLITLNIQPVFAMRDFNITPRMLRDTFELPTDGYDFPPFTERYELTGNEKKEHVVLNSIICRDGLAPLVNTVTTGKNIFRATKLNLYVTIPGTAVFMLVVFFKLLAAGSITFSLLLVMILILSIPVFIFSILV